MSASTSASPRKASRPEIQVDFGSSQEAEAIMHHATSMDKVADALVRIATQMEVATAQRKPMDTFFAEASVRLDAFCRKLGKYGPWFLASVPLVLTSVGAVSPNVAKALAKIIAGFPQ